MDNQFGDHYFSVISDEQAKALRDYAIFRAKQSSMMLAMSEGCREGFQALYIAFVFVVEIYHHAVDEAVQGLQSGLRQLTEGDRRLFRAQLGGMLKDLKQMGRQENWHSELFGAMGSAVEAGEWLPLIKLPSQVASLVKWLFTTDPVRVYLAFWLTELMVAALSTEVLSRVKLTFPKDWLAWLKEHDHFEGIHEKASLAVTNFWLWIQCDRNERKKGAIAGKIDEQARVYIDLYFYASEEVFRLLLEKQKVAQSASQF